MDGEFSGIIQSTNVISIGKSGVVEGEVTAHKLMVTGQFRGNADCNEIEILAGGKVTGQISTSVLVIERGSTFDGESRLKGEITQIQQQPAYENIGYSPEA